MREVRADRFDPQCAGSNPGVEIVTISRRMQMKALKLAIGSLAYWMTALAMAGTAPNLGFNNLPILEGGMLTVAVVGLVAGIRIIQRKNKR